MAPGYFRGRLAGLEPDGVELVGCGRQGRRRAKLHLVDELVDEGVVDEGVVCSLRDDEGSQGGMGGEDAVVSDGVKTWRRDEGAESSDEVERGHGDGVGAVRPRSLHGVGEGAVGPDAEPVGGDRRTGEVSDEPFEPLAVAAVDLVADVEGEAVVLYGEAGLRG